MFGFFATSIVIPIVVHDWTITVRGWCFGILEEDLRPNYSDPSTTLFVGSTSFHTDLSAWTLLSILAVGLLVAVAVVAMVVAKLRGKPA